MTKQCPRCGAIVAEGVQFCGACGSPTGEQVGGVKSKQAMSIGQMPKKSLPKWAWWVGGGVLAALVVTTIVLGFVFADRSPVLRITAAVLLLLVWIGVTALGAYVAFKKKRKVLGILCIATLIYGFIFAIIAFFISPKPPVTQLSEKCPVCQGQVGTEEAMMLEKGTNKKGISLAYTILAAVLGGIVGLILAIMAISVWAEGDDGIIRWAYGSTIAGAGILVVGFAMIGWGVEAVMRYRKVERVAGKRFRCSQCKFMWMHALDAPAVPTPTPLPTGNPPAAS